MMKTEAGLHIFWKKVREIYGGEKFLNTLSPVVEHILLVDLIILGLHCE